MTIYERISEHEINILWDDINENEFEENSYKNALEYAYKNSMTLFIKLFNHHYSSILFHNDDFLIKLIRISKYYNYEALNLFINDERYVCFDNKNISKNLYIYNQIENLMYLINKKQNIEHDTLIFILRNFKSKSTQLINYIFEKDFITKKLTKEIIETTHEEYKTLVSFQILKNNILNF
jgi:hypothetical protein